MKMANVSYQIANLLDKMTSTDKDYRFMATNDLMSELQKDSIKLDDDSEKKVVKMVLKLLEDKNGEVQNLAVKCLGPLVIKVKEYHVYSIVESLCDHMISSREQLRDMSSLALKTVINELPPTSTSLVANICKRVTDRLSEAIVKQDDVSIQLEALDILSDLLARFGSLLVSFHASIVEALLPQLSSPRLAVRKRAMVALSHLVVSCSMPIYDKLMEYLIQELAMNVNTSTTRTYIQCISAISRQSGHKFGEYLDKVMPLITSYVTVEDDELREYCISACESFALRCPKEITPHLGMIVDICLKFISHDPNYNYDDYEVDDDGQMDLDEDDDDDEDDEYSDDDDISWKVRRASAKCLEAVISTRHEMLLEFYTTVSPQLIQRFKEREENVKVDIFNAYIALLKQTKPSISNASVDPDAMDHEEGTIVVLKQQVPDLVKALHRQMREKSIKTRQGCFQLLTELINVSPGSLTNHIPALIPGIQYSLGDKFNSSNMKIGTLSFIHCLLMQHTGQIFHPYVKDLLPAIVTCVSDTFYKITAEALLVLQQIVKVIRPLDQPSSFDFTLYTGDLYHCTLSRLKAADLDQEVKERAIACMGQIISHLGDHLQGELGVCLPIFLDRLRNEITRLTTVKALTKISASPLRIDLRPILPTAYPILGSFLRKNQRALKMSTLTLIDNLVNNYPTAIDEMVKTVLPELPALINEADLHVAQLSLTLLTSVTTHYKHTLPRFIHLILPSVLQLVRSPLLQGGALKAMQDLFEAFVKADVPGLSYEDLLNRLLAPLVPSQSATFHKQAYHSVAKCVAALTLTQPNEAINVVNRFVLDVANPRTPTIQSFSLLAIGEIGRNIDLSGVNGIKETVIQCFSSSNEEVKSAASYSLGLLSCGNLQYFLPLVLREIETNPKKQYLLLHSLKEIINIQSRTTEGIAGLQTYVGHIWDQLFQHTECVEEGTRNVVAECLGKLTIMDPTRLLPKLQQALKCNSPMMRTTVVTAVKFTISDQPAAIDNLLRGCIGEFLAMIQDPDLCVRRVALVAFNSAAHNKPSLVRDLLPALLPQLYNETKIRKELIHEVEMGPFKHPVDDGLDIRKAAFECMYTLLETCLDRIDVYVFLEHVEEGLKDHYDIKMLTYLMLARLARLCPQAVLQRLERLVDPLRITVTSKVKANSVKQEYEKQDELKRSAMRAISALLTIPEADKNPQLIEFMNHIKSTNELKELYETIQKDSGVYSDSTYMDLS